MSLEEAFRSVAEPRRAQGRRHELGAILALATRAMLCGAKSLYAIAPWGRDQSPELVAALGFTRPATPCVATLHRVFRRLDLEALDLEAFEGALRVWARGNLPAGEQAIAVDGKALRGIHGKELPGVRLVAAYAVAAYAHEAGLVLAQLGVRALALGKREVELKVAPALLDQLSLEGMVVTTEGMVVTTDALHTQRQMARRIVARRWPGRSWLGVGTTSWIGTSGHGGSTQPQPGTAAARRSEQRGCCSKTPCPPPQ